MTDRVTWDEDIIMHWEKKKLIYVPDQSIPWMQSHAQVPTAMLLSDRIRLYFASRNAAGKSQIGCIDVAKEDPAQILKVYSEPVFSFGKPGTFDDDGVMPSHIQRVKQQWWLFYSGWNQRTHVPYHNAMGLAVSDDDGLSFHRISDGPIMDRNFDEPYLAVTPTILCENNQWRMWYISGIRWELIHNRHEPIYVIKYAESSDGIYWRRYAEPVIPQHYPLEAFSRPYIVKIDGHYFLWYCYRNSLDYRDGTGSYRLGFARSTNGMNWQRADEQVGISVAENGFDSTMICYPCIIQVNHDYLLFYNGNGFGRSGIGYAKLTLR